MHKKIVILLLISSHLSGKEKYPQEGICCVPVADITIEPLSQYYPNIPYTKWPSLISFCPQDISSDTFLRISQLLLNDKVLVLEEKGNEYRIQALAQSYANRLFTHNRIFWAAKHTIFITNHKQAEKIYTIRPLFIQELGCTVSAGTELELLQTSNNKYRCKSLHPTSKQNVSFLLDTKHCCIPYQDKQKQKKAFVQLIRYWAQQEPKKIPYVLGGSSIVETAIPDDFLLQKEGYERPSVSSLRAGLDCAHLVFLAARMSGIPIKSTNTLGLAKTLQPFKETDTLEAGDILLWKGHVVIITDPDKGLLAEARGYGSGYGVIQEIPFKETFKEVQESNDLIDAYRHRKSLTRLDKNGKKEQTITSLSLYKLP